jgi:hypothetical protein
LWFGESKEINSDLGIRREKGDQDRAHERQRYGLGSCVHARVCTVRPTANTTTNIFYQTTLSLQYLYVAKSNKVISNVTTGKLDIAVRQLAKKPICSAKSLSCVDARQRLPGKGSDGNATFAVRVADIARQRLCHAPTRVAVRACFAMRPVALPCGRALLRVDPLPCACALPCGWPLPCAGVLP